ncbi:hypothetical protein [Pseudocolwellia agarivorans]|uniref:hypothetical protein n=1 Tax=Pseudocolwellia agarivorans TaxID=1911682 RepID=UPI0009851BF3|nr:hypothetical protein [Pseudocolwellia agarivorans]
MMHLIKGFCRGFVGGPDFNRCITHHFILGDKQLTLQLPDSNVMAVPNKVDVSFPHTSTSWFEQNAKTYEQHKFVRIVTENWMYVPVISIIPGDEFGMLSCQLRIKQTDKINVLDKQALANFLIQEYEDYHNRSDGKNTKIRQEIIEQSSKMFRPFEAEALEEEIKGWIENRGMPPIPAAYIKSFNQIDWVFYQEVRNNRLSRNDYYCLPLSENSFLEVDFRHRVDRSDKHKKWSNHALASQERIMESITLSDIPDEQDNLIILK